MSYRLLKQLAHGLALLVLQRWSIWLLLVVVGAIPTPLVVVVLMDIELRQDLQFPQEQPTH